jgi:hypothetical protein
MDLRAGFVYLRARDSEELSAELRFAPELELRFLPGEARNGALALGGAAVAPAYDAAEQEVPVALTLRRERTGCFVGAAPAAFAFEPAPGAAAATLPFALVKEKQKLMRGVLRADVHAPGAPPAWSLTAVAGACGEGDCGVGFVDVELVLVGNDNARGAPVCLSAVASLAPPLALLPPGPFLRTNSAGRTPCGGLEPIDEERKARARDPRGWICARAPSPNQREARVVSGAQPQPHVRRALAASLTGFFGFPTRTPRARTRWRCRCRAASAAGRTRRASCTAVRTQLDHC